MPRYDNGDSNYPNGISWFEDIPYNDGDSDNPYPFDNSPASSGVKDGYHPDDISWFKDNPYNDGDSNNPYHFNDSPASFGIKDGYHDHLSVPGFITMDPHQDCANIIATPGRAPSPALRTLSCNPPNNCPNYLTSFSASLPPQAPPYLATSSFPRTNVIRKRPFLSTSKMQAVRSRSSPAPILPNSW